MEFNQPNLPPRKQPAGFTTPGATIYDHASRSTKTTGSNPCPTPRGCHPFARNNRRPQPKNKTKKEKRAWPAARSVSARTHVVGSESRKPVSFRGPGSKTGRPQVDCATPTVVNGGTQSLSPGTEARPVQTDTGEGGGFPLV